MMKPIQYLLFILSISLLFGLGNEIHASHIPGANITYTCNPSNPLEYTFRLTLFRRCPGTHPSTMSASYFTFTNSCGATNPISPIFNQVGIETDVNQLCSSAISNCNGGSDPGIYMYIYEATVTLPSNCDGWTLTYDLCCRDASSNISGSSSQDMVVTTTLNTLTAPCNNSPVVTSAPIPYACTNTNFSYCLTIADPEGDSVTFQMQTPYGAGLTPLTHLAGYSTNAPLNNFTLDPLTGCISFNHPTTGNYVVAIRINSYNSSGQLIASIVHDFQVMVINCTNTPPSNPTGGIVNFSGSGTLIGNNTIAACYGDAFCFDVVFQDLVDVSDVLIISQDGTTLLPGATFTQTGTNPVTGTFCWTAQPGFTGSIVTFVANDNGCPVMGSTGFAVDFNIATGVYAGPDPILCGTQTAQLQAFGASSYTWTPSSGLSCTNCSNPVANPLTTTSYIVTGNLSGSCPNVDTITVHRVPLFPLTVTPASATICANGAVPLNAGGPALSGPFTYLWTPNASLNADNIANPIASPMTSTTYTVSVTAANGCTQATTIPITVSGIGPTVSIDPSDTSICAGVPTQITTTTAVYPITCGISSGCSGTNSSFDIGTNTSSTTTYSPFAGSTSTTTNYNTKMQYIFTAAELNALGYFGGTIRTIAFYNTTSYAYTYDNVTISMGCTSQDQYTNTQFIPNASLTQVFGPVNNFNPVDNNWQTFNISDFDWDGTSNLVIQFCAQEDNSNNEGWESIQYTTTTPAYRYMYYYSTIAGAACPSTTGNRVTNRPNMRFNMCEQAVSGPTYAWSPTTGLSNSTISNPIATPTTSTTYLLNVTDGASGCIGSAIAQFNVSPDYSLNTTATQPNICYGASTSISTTPSVGGSYTYLWEPSGSLTAPTSQSTAASPPATTTYTVTVSNGNCVRTDDITINVSGGPIGVYASTDTVCPGTPILLDLWTMPQTCGLNTAGCMGITNNYTLGNSSFSTSTYSPFYGSYADYKMQILYTAAELQAMGMTAGTITNLAFNVITKYTTGPFTNYTVSMGCTNATALVNTAWEATAGVVYGPTSYTTAVGWNTIPLTTGFDWDGVSNVVVEICWDMSAAISYDNIEYSNPGFVCFHRSYNSAGVPGCTLPPAYTYSGRPNTRFTLCGGGLPAGATYTWSPSINLSDPSIQNPTADLWGDITYTVSVTDPANPACPGVGTRSLTIDRTNSVTATPDTAFCGGASSVQLNAAYTGPLPAISKNCGTGQTCSGTNTTGVSGVSTSATSSYTPFYGSTATATDYEAKSQYIFTAAELTAMGFQTGVIRDLSIFVTTTNAYRYDDFTIYMGCTSQNEYDATATFIPTGSLTQVYGPIGNFNPTDNAWNTFNITDFGWDGVSNIVVQICATEDNVEGNNGYNSVRYSTTTPAYRCLYYYSSSVNNICNYATGYRTTNRPNMQFNICSEFPTNATYSWSPAGTLNNPNIANPLATPLSATDYIVTATGGNCVVYDTVSVILSTPSTAPSLAGPAMVCPNTPVTLAASGGTAGVGSTIEWYTGPNGTGTWLGTGANYTFTPTGTTTIYTRREGGCNNTTDAVATVNVRDYIYAANGTSTNNYCTDAAGWHHFYSGSDIIFSVQGDLSGAPAGFPIASIYDNGVYYQQAQGPLTATSCANGWTPGEEWFEMERSWDLDFGGGTPNGTYNVRFYYQPAEKTAIETAANNWMATYPVCGYAYKYPAYTNGFYWFKNTGSNYTAPDYDGTHYMPATNNVTATTNAVNYSEWSGIPNFSGGSGAIKLIPTNPLLPVDWLYFKGNTDGTVNHLQWATATEANTSHFNLQRSMNGINFETIATIAAAGNSSTESHYSYNDEHPITGVNYYRLELVDLNNDIEKSNIVPLLITKDNTGYSFYPNPTNDVVYYQYQATAAEDLKIEVIDALGRILQVYNKSSAVGINNIAIDLKDYPAGAYMLRVQNQNSGNVHIAKVVKRGL